MPRTNRLLVAKNYTPMTHDQFRDAMNNTLRMTAADFAWITGTSHRRVKQWIVGVEQIPPWVTLMCALLTLPRAKELAVKVTREFSTEVPPPA